MASIGCFNNTFYKGGYNYLTKAYEEELKQKRDKILKKLKRFANLDCSDCLGKGFLTYILGQRKHERREILRTCSCVTKNLNRLDDIKKGKIKYPEDWEYKDRVIDAKKENGKWKLMDQISQN